MFESSIAIGMGCVGILQVANLWQSRKLENTIGTMVRNDQCGERRTACRGAVNMRAENIHQELRAVERKMDHHVHSNGNGVKYYPVK